MPTGGRSAEVQRDQNAHTPSRGWLISLATRQFAMCLGILLKENR